MSENKIREITINFSLIFISVNLIKFVDFSIIFNKNKYFAGDKVVATFYVDGVPHKNTRNLVISLKSGENVGVEVTDHDGDSSTHWERTVYNENKVSIPVDEVVFPFAHSLEFSAPEFPSENVNEYNFEVYHRAEIKLDIARRKDLIYFEDIPLVASANVSPLKIELKEKDIIVSLDTKQPYPGETIRFNISNYSNIKFRAYRLELRQTLFRTVGSHTAKKINTEILEKMDPLPSIGSDVKLPEMIFSSITGDNFEIVTELRFVFDRSMKKDINMSIPFAYFRERSGVNCGACGFSNTSDAIYCMECGISLNKK